jgi:hypothetical protein
MILLKVSITYILGVRIALIWQKVPEEEEGFVINGEINSG